MGDSSQLRLLDFRAVFNAVGECCELWDDPRAWRQHAVASACRIVGARTAHLIDVTAADVPTPALVPRLLADHGFDTKAERGHLLASLKEPFGNVTPEAERLMREVARNGAASAARPALASTEEWRRFEGYQQFRRPAGCDEFAISLRLSVTPKGPALSLLGVDREPGDRAATERERQVLGLLHGELKARIGTVLSTETHIGRDGLSPREHQTLDGLLDGLSEKEIAARLSLSTPTVHQYVTSLYRHFNVSSRGELMSYYVRRQPRLRSAIEE